MFESSPAVDPAALFPALAAAIRAVPVHPDRSGLAGVPVTAQTRALLGLRRELDARLVARVAAVDEQGLAAGDGFASTASWLRGFGNLDAGHAVSLVKAARVAEALPHLAEVLARGKIGVEHLQAVAGGARRVPVQVLAEHDHTLRNLAPHARPADLRRAAAKIQACHDENAVAADAAHVHDSRQVSVARTFGGAYHLEGLLTPEAGAALVTALDALMAKRGPEDTRSPGQRRHDALTELTQLALAAGTLPDLGGDRPRLTFLVQVPTTTSATPDAGTDAGTGAGAVAGPAGVGSAGRCPGSAGPALLRGMLADLVGAFTGTSTGAGLPGSALPGFELPGFELPGGEPPGAGQRDGGGCPVTAFGVGAAALIGTDALLPAQSIARICCDADLAVAGVNEWGEPINLYRASRSPNVAQRRALVIRDGGCVFPGCDQPPAHCQAHHLKYWSAGGHTNLDNLALTCWFHHHLLHEGGWRLHRIPPHPGPPAQPPGWLATGPQGQQLRQFRQPAA